MDDRDILMLEQRRRTLLVRVFIICAIASLALVSGQFYFGVFKQPTLQLAKAVPEDDPDALAKAKDTDSDGISDYDESHLYGTSPYLSDTDSDGFDDRTELLSGNDPNCPKGKTCGVVTELPAGLTPDDLGVKDPGAMPSTSLDALDRLVNATPAQVRELMKKNGVDEATLAKLSDADLMASYRAALEKSGVKPGATPTEIVPKNPTPQEIRDLLEKNGMKKEDVAKLTDEELVQLYQDSLTKTANP